MIKCNYIEYKELSLLCVSNVPTAFIGEGKLLRDTENGVEILSCNEWELAVAEGGTISLFLCGEEDYVTEKSAVFKVLNKEIADRVMCAVGKLNTLKGWFDV